MQFIPFEEIKNHTHVLAVDCHHPRAFPLSHWKGVKQPIAIQDDTSTGIVLNAIKAEIPEIHYPFASNNHFDIDGFLGIWSLIHPQIALENEALLRHMALIADFREFDPHDNTAEKALQLVCWINQVERSLFYAPFGSKKEAKMCVEKYHYFLQHFNGILLAPQQAEKQWRAEFDRVWNDLDLIEKQGSKKIIESIKLQIVQAPEPLHYYALYAGSQASDMVLMMYNGQRYELENKYTTWISAYLRASFPRLDFRKLAELLNQLERTEMRWSAESYKDTAPILRLASENLTKEQRFDHPYKRNITPSNIAPEVMMETVINHCQAALKEIKPQLGGFSWAETQQLHELIY